MKKGVVNTDGITINKEYKVAMLGAVLLSNPGAIRFRKKLYTKLTRNIKIKTKIVYPKVFHHLPFTSCLLLFNESRIPFLSPMKIYSDNTQKTPKIIPGIIKRRDKPITNRAATMQNPTNAQ